MRKTYQGTRKISVSINRSAAEAYEFLSVPENFGIPKFSEMSVGTWHGAAQGRRRLDC